MNIDMTMFQQTFFEETEEILVEFERLLLRLEETPDEQDLLNTIFRCAHSIKGGSATFGFADVAHFTHSLETLLDLLRNGQAKVDRNITQLLLESLDQVKALLAAARGEAATAPDSDALIFQIEEIIAQTGYQEEIWDEDALRIEIARMVAEQEAASSTTTEARPAPGLAGSHAYHLHFAPGADDLRRGADPAAPLKRLAEASSKIAVRCDLSRLPSLEALDPETCYLSWDVDFCSDWEPSRLLDLFESVRETSEITLEETTPAVMNAPDGDDGIANSNAASVGIAVARPNNIPSTTPRWVPAAGAPAVKGETQTLRVATAKVDKLINLVGELVINQSMLNEVVQDFSMEKLPRLREAVADMERASRELQERVMAVRMLPIKTAFGRFPRLVHDLSMACGKQVELKTTGEETELDKSVIEGIADPITHLIRNSVDHGMETPNERRAAGKPETGVVSLHAFHEGGSIIIEVTDDGRGLDRERILHKAYERGLLSESEPVPSDETLYNFIFHPGFSTAPAVTDVSGRGVGMDIVQQSVQGLGGTITLNSTRGKGTRFRIRLPLTMAILEGLSISVGEEVYILPLTSIVESIRPKSDDVRHIAGKAEVVMVRDETLPVLRLYQVFGAVPRFIDPARGLLVIVESDGHKVALLVDELIGQNQAVIKSLEANYKKVDGIAGATIMGNGRVALIVDVPGLIRAAYDRPISLAA
jgi:two-component system chemotaxis sensor kinase CheA